MQVALSVWPAYQPRHCPGTHCSLREQDEKEDRSATEFEITGKMEESQIIEEKWQTCWCCRDKQRACRMAQASADEFEQTGLAEKERMASGPQ